MDSASRDAAFAGILPESVNVALLGQGLAAGLAGGLAGGTLAGLAGIGGGLIYVPLFLALMPATSDAHALSAPVLASLGAVAITGLLSARAHARLGHVRKAMLKQLLPGLAAGAALGLWSTLRLPASAMFLGLAALDAWVARDYGREAKTLRRPSLPLSWTAGFIGLVSGLFGIGGGTMLAPLLRRRLPLREAVGTTALCGALMALLAVGVNLALERDWRLLLGPLAPWIAGAWLGVALSTSRAVRLGAELHARWREDAVRMMLRLMFASLAAAYLAAAIWTAIRS